MNDCCKFADGEYEPCQGPLLRINDNAKVYPTIYCEHHARMVHAWAIDQTAPRPFHKFWDRLTRDELEVFRVKMEAVSLDSFIPYVPHLTQRALDAGYAPAPEVAFQPDLLSTAPAKSKPARRK